MFRRFTASLGDLTHSGTTSKTRAVKEFDAQKHGIIAYRISRTVLGKRLTKTLNEYVKESPERHGEYLKHGFIQHTVIKQFFPEMPTRKKCFQIAEINMHVSYEKFQAFITALLGGLPQTAPLYKALKDTLLNAGFDIQQETNGYLTYRLVYVGLAQKPSKSAPSLLEAIKSKVSGLYSSTEQLHKSEVIKGINKTNQERLHLTRKTLLLRKVIQFHKDYVTWCDIPAIEYIDFSKLTDRRPKQEDNLEVLLKLQSDVENENRAIKHEFTLLFNSLPSTDDPENPWRLMALPVDMSVTRVCREIETVLLHTPEGWRDAIRNTRGLYRQAYEDESVQNADRLRELRELNRLFVDIRGIVSWEDMDQAVWAQNLMVEWLRKNTPAALCKTGPIKSSSGLRKAWKGQLAAWDISWKPRITGANATAVTPTCFQGFLRFR